MTPPPSVSMPRRWRALDVLGILDRVAAVGCLVQLGTAAMMLGRIGAMAREMRDDSDPQMQAHIERTLSTIRLMSIGMIVFLFLFALLLWMAGGWIRRRRRWGALVASHVVALGVAFPVGAALGVFGLVTLLRRSGREAFLESVEG